ncbi:MAG: hypothetical protein HXY27_01050 [Hydrogenophilaceae bacterium]|nr:hypothetical protein [Hydrogenophilaceae bacterium]
MIRANLAARLLASITLGLALTLPAHAYPQKAWRFQVLLDDKPIGHHNFTLRLEHSGKQILQSQAEFNVSFLGIPAYRYRHNTVERWEQGCLTEIASQTHRNGQTVILTGKKDKREMVLATDKGEVVLAGCVMSFAYWNPDILKQRRLLNAETGEYHEVRVKSLGGESLALPGKSVMAKHYRLETDRFSIDLWYGPDAQWLALESKIEGGRSLRYVIDPTRQSLQVKSRHA